MKTGSINISFIVKLASLITLSTNIGCSGSELNSIVVIDSAQNVQETVSDDGSRVQISYQVEMAYPNLAVGDSIQRALESHGWTECLSNNPRWNIYEDASEPISKFIHSNVSYWSNGYSLMMIASTFRSSFRNQTQKSLPDDEIQNVVILVDYFQLKESFQEVVRRLQIQCAKSASDQGN